MVYEISQKIGIGWTSFVAVAMETKKGDLKFVWILSSNFMKLCRNIQTKMCGRIIRIIRIIIVKKKRRIAIHHPTTVGVT
jgi:hypothetical protein